MRARQYFLAMAVTALAAPAAAAPKPVAELVSVDGNVNVTRAVGGAVDAARALGSKVRNGSIWSGDEVSLDAGAVARLQFADGSVLELRQGARLTIAVDDPPPAVVEGGAAARPVARKIYVLGGQVMVRMVANPAVVTEFETPLGSAAVPKAAVFTLAVRPVK